jgi:hypothetical protein
VTVHLGTDRPIRDPLEFEIQRRSNLRDRPVRDLRSKSSQGNVDVRLDSKLCLRECMKTVHAASELGELPAMVEQLTERDHERSFLADLDVSRSTTVLPFHAPSQRT